MKKLLPLLTLCMGLCCVSCYDDSPILERLETLEKTTISALQASISALEAKDADILKSIAALENSDRATQEEIETLRTLSSEIEKKIVELKEWIEKILEGYYTSEEIDGQLASINEAIKTLTEQVSSLESKLNNQTAEFAIVFDDSEVGILAGGTTSVGYTITGATEKTTVKALGQNGWSAKVTPKGTDKGTITVTAPNPLTEDEIIVLVYDGEYRTIMSSINFVTGVVTPSQTAVELEAEAGTIDITVTSNLNYKVSIPEDAKGWLSVVETKTTKTETLTFAYTECVGGIRKAIVAFVDEANNTISNMTFVQQGSTIEVTLTEAGTLLETIGEDYLSIKSLQISGEINGTDIYILRRMCSNLGQLRYLDIENANIVSGGEIYCNEHINGQEKTYTTENNVIGACMFGTRSMYYSSILETIILPRSVVKICEYAFADCAKLKSVKMHSGVQSIGSCAFFNCGLDSIEFPDTIISIENDALWRCKKLKKVILPNNLEVISSCLLHSCYELTDIFIPESVTLIENAAFYSCSKLTSVTIPKNVKQIQASAFNSCDNIKTIRVQSSNIDLNGASIFSNNIYDSATLYIPKGSYSYYQYTEFSNFKNIIEE